MFSNQALVMGVSFVVLFLALIGNMMVPWVEMKNKMLVIALTVFVIAPLMVLSVFTVNCTVYGTCNSLAGIYAGITVVFTVLYTGYFVYKLIKYKKSLEKES